MGLKPGAEIISAGLEIGGQDRLSLK